MNPTGINTPRPIVQLTADGEYVKEYPSLRATAISMGLKDSRILTSCCSGKNYVKTVNGFRFLYKADYDPNKDYSFHFDMNRKPVVQMDLDGNEIKRFKSLYDAVQSFNARNVKGISRCCHGKQKTYKGYRWKFADI